MSFIKDRVSGIGRAALAAFLIVIAIACGLIAFGFIAMALFTLIQIVSITLWLTIKAGLLFIGAAILAAIAYGALSLGGRK